MTLTSFDAQDLLTAAKAASRINDTVTLNEIYREAQSRIVYDHDNEPDPVLHDVLCCISELSISRI
jgi:hypothetical protein